MKLTSRRLVPNFEIFHGGRSAREILLESAKEKALAELWTRLQEFVTLSTWPDEVNDGWVVQAVFETPAPPRTLPEGFRLRDLFPPLPPESPAPTLDQWYSRAAFAPEKRSFWLNTLRALNTFRKKISP